MEPQELHGVFETVPAFSYRTYIRDKLVRREYAGHRRLLAAFAYKPEAETYKKDKVNAANASRTGGYMQIHECAYRLATEALYDIQPVDTMPAVAHCPS